jgi:hypothetical protein
VGEWMEGQQRKHTALALLPMLTSRQPTQATPKREPCSDRLDAYVVTGNCDLPSCLASPVDRR